MNIMTVDNFQANIAYDDEIGMFRGTILGLSGGADFYGKSVEELRQEFKHSLVFYLDVCKAQGIAPLASDHAEHDLT